MVFTLIAIILVVYSWIDFKNSVIFLCIFELFLNQNINLINVPGVPLLLMSTALNIYFTIYFFLVQRKKFVSSIDRFPLKIAFILIGFSILLSCLFSLSGFTIAITRGIQDFFSPYLFVWMVWYVIKTPKDFKKLITLLTISFSFFVIYAFYEKATGERPVITYEQALNVGTDQSRVINWSYEDDERTVGGRVQSVFIHPIGAGMNFGLCFVIFTYLFIYYRRYIILSPYIVVWLLSSLLLCVFFSNSRGPLIFLGIAVLGLVKFKSRKFYLITILGIILLIFLYSYIAPYMDNIFSFANAKAKERVGGSDVFMRQGQFAAAYQLFQQNPLFGNGVKSLSYISNSNLVKDLLGFESVWIPLMVERGLIGLLSYIFLIFSMFKSAKGKTKGFTIYLTLAYVIVSSVTSTPGFVDYLFFIILFFSIRLGKGAFIKKRLMRDNI